MTDEAIIERVERALCNATDAHLVCSYPECRCRVGGLRARAAIAEYEAALKEAGEIVVPRKPTEAMEKAGFFANVFENRHDGEPGCPGIPDPGPFPHKGTPEEMQAWIDKPRCWVARVTMSAIPAWHAMIQEAEKP